MSKRRFIQPGSTAELRAVIALIRQREHVDPDNWEHIFGLIERGIAMHVIGEAFTELVDDNMTLFDESSGGHHGAAIVLSLDRDAFGGLTIGVSLRQIDGGQLAYVLDVARRHELQVREESGWLRLSPQLIYAETDDEEAEVASAT